MPNKLHRLVIEEISSVPAGAAGDAQGRGRARVLLRKSLDNERTPPMTPTSVAKSLIEKLQNGAISSFEFAERQQQLAQVMFPGEANIGRALAKFFTTLPGQEMLANTRQPEQAEVFAKKHTENIEPVAMGGERYYPASGADKDAPTRNSPAWHGEVARIAREQNVSLEDAEAILEGRSGKPMHAKDDDDDDGDDWGGANVKTPAEKIAHYMKATGTKNWDRAATAVFRKML